MSLKAPLTFKEMQTVEAVSTYHEQKVATKTSPCLQQLMVRPRQWRELPASIVGTHGIESNSASLNGTALSSRFSQGDCCRKFIKALHFGRLDKERRDQSNNNIYGKEWLSSERLHRLSNLTVKWCDQPLHDFLISHWKLQTASQDCQIYGIFGDNALVTLGYFSGNNRTSYDLP